MRIFKSTEVAKRFGAISQIVQGEPAPPGPARLCHERAAAQSARRDRGHAAILGSGIELRCQRLQVFVKVKEE
jgi:hypothetical protein